ncbi:hypothetical protein EfmJHP38_08830 [Enterococcus faecium]|nr:hypothetical protein EfmJHP38_08830 [Enterococcus faecium]
MTQVHFTLKSEEIQSIIEYSVKDDVSKNILTTVFNQLMENQRTEYIQAKEYERTENRQSQRNGYYERSFTTRVGTLELKVPRTRDGHFSPTVFERYQRNEKALMASMLEMLWQSNRSISICLMEKFICPIEYLFIYNNQGKTTHDTGHYDCE